jgi:hypothetical protein
MAKEMIDQVGCKVVILTSGEVGAHLQVDEEDGQEDALKLARIIEQFRDDRLPKATLPSDREMMMKLLAARCREVKPQDRDG